jgi:hypothetical protein
MFPPKTEDRDHCFRQMKMGKFDSLPTAPIFETQKQRHPGGIDAGDSPTVENEVLGHPCFQGVGYLAPPSARLGSVEPAVEVDYRLPPGCF